MEENKNTLNETEEIKELTPEEIAAATVDQPAAAPEVIAEPAKAEEKSENADEDAPDIYTPAQVIRKDDKKSKKPLIIGIICGAVLLIGIGLTVFFLSMGGGDEIADPDAEYIDIQVNNYYTGVVEPQQTSGVTRDPERTVSKVYVSVGDTVEKGDKLFSYDQGEAEIKLQQAKLEYDGINNEITGINNQITELKNERAKASEDMQLEYTIQIQELEASLKQQQLDLKMKQVEIDSLETALEKADVTSPISGIIKQINNTADGSDSSGYYITILMSGAYRVKGMIDETNVGNISEGMDVIIHSRSNADQTWNGKITKIDTESQSSGNNDAYDMGGGESASKYTFYCSLESNDNILLGQHVYIEPLFDFGDGDIDISYDDAEADGEGAEGKG